MVVSVGNQKLYLGFQLCGSQGSEPPCCSRVSCFQLCRWSVEGSANERDCIWSVDARVPTSGLWKGAYSLRACGEPGPG